MRRLLVPLLVALLSGSPAAAQELRLGLIGTDTSHVIAFTKAFNGPPGPDHVEGARVVAAFRGGSDDVEASYSRIEAFSEELRSEWGVEFVEAIGDLCSRVDALLLTSVDGRTHLEQARQAFACGKPLFIDKPLASTLADARAIARLGEEAGVPWFSSSSLRWSEIVTELRRDDALGAATWGPGPTEPHHQLDLSWYAIHPIEMLFALMGPGCREVTRFHADSGDVLVGRWADGRLGTVRVFAETRRYGAVVYRPEEVEQSRPGMATAYTPMLREMLEFFRTGRTPVPVAETLEIFAFMDAAQRSLELRGLPVRLDLPPLE
jgi:predicted dehydrogenase